MKIENLDLRGMESPKPLLKVLSKVESLPADTALEAILDQCPFQLYDLLQQRGWKADYTKREDGAIRLQAVPKAASSSH